MLIMLLFIFLNCLLILFICAIAQIFNPTAELVIPIKIPSKEEKEDVEIHIVIVEAKIRKCSINLELYKAFCAFYSSIHFTLFPQENNFLFHLYFSI